MYAIIGYFFKWKKMKKCFAIKPTLMSSHYKINVLPKSSKNSEPFVITYTHNPFARIIRYRKVNYDPLTYDQAGKWLYALIKQFLLLPTKNIKHNSIRVPNIRFSKNYNIVLIDFDRAEI